VKKPGAPQFEGRRKEELSAELRKRAQAWMPSWDLSGGERDFGHALLEIAARFSSEVAERLDNVGEKMRRGFLDWLAVRGTAAKPTQLPVVFKLADAAQEPVLASAPVQLQAEAEGSPVVFETERDLRVVPGRLEVVVGVDADNDKFYLSPPGLNDLKPLEPLPTQWVLKSYASAGATKLQLNPDAGLKPEMIIEAAGQQYRIVQVDNEIVTIDPVLQSEIQQDTIVRKVTTFSPFDGIAINRQEHALYLGHMDLLNIESAATIEVVGATALRTGVTWQYWGKVDGNGEDDWQPLELAKADEQRDDAVVLRKEKGAVEPRNIDRNNSRWIRAITNVVKAEDAPFTVDQLSLRINSFGCIPNSLPCPSAVSTTSPIAEALTNNTPLVLSEPFYPLGREPRQFDAFYLGCDEAFSKRAAEAQICFQMADATCLAYTAVSEGHYANQIVAGVGKDRTLHLFRLSPTGAVTLFRGPLRPPRPVDPSAQLRPTSMVELNPRCRPVIWNGSPNNDDFYVAVAAGGDIWIWHENASDQKQSGWKFHSRVPNVPGVLAQIEDIVVLKSRPRTPGALLSNGRFWVYDGTDWIQPQGPQNVPLQNYAAVVPIHDHDNKIPTDSLVAISVAQKLYRLEPNGTETEILEGQNLHGPDVDVGRAPQEGGVPVGAIRPSANLINGSLHIVAVGARRDELIAIRLGNKSQRISLGGGAEVVGAEIAQTTVSGKIQFSVCVKTTAGGILVASWVPTFADNDPTILFESSVSEAASNMGGSPLIVGSYVVTSGSRGDMFIADFNPSRRLEFTTKIIGEGLILPNTAPFGVNDFLSVIVRISNKRKEWKIKKAPSTSGEEVVYVVDPPNKLQGHIADDPQLIGYLAASSGMGTHEGGKRITLSQADPAISTGTLLRILVEGKEPVIREVDKVTLGQSKTDVELTAALPGNNKDTLSYWKPIPSVARVVPTIEFTPLADGIWDSSILDGTDVYIPSSPSNVVKPSPQRAIAFSSSGGHTIVVTLTQRWELNAPDPSKNTPFIIDGVFSNWRQQVSDTSSNPALSWEYSNGKGWWSLPISEDGTNRFGTTGAVKFKIPNDIAESDWSGKTNYWIRARLVGGNYGQEEVKVISRPGSKPGETEQIIERSSDNIRAPQVLDMHISYAICESLPPTSVFTQDSGSMRDQSEANRTAGAVVEAFVPLALMLGRLSHASTPTASSAECPPDCRCHGKKGTGIGASIVTTGQPPASIQPMTGRALFIGLEATVSGEPVNVLLLVEKEQDHSGLLPLKIEALVADRFIPIVADDGTRGVGESGLLSMAFAIPPTRGELFGETLTWLRLSPRAGTDTTHWKPSLRGAYLNAAWASATETLTRELVGSSDGSPNLTMRLARPPVLHGTLELRVKEPLGDEERVALRKDDARRVLSDVQDLPGDWVLWKQVTDPGDEQAMERVYRFDEATGEIGFGDGQHGMIPPIGRDSIVAFSYQRTEPPKPGSETVPGNLIAPRTALNLVSPVEGVEAVTAADQAAGGAPPEPDDRVLRFGFSRLRHRNRAVTSQDLEDLALQSSSDIAQARCFVRRGFIRLVIVMRGKSPIPSSAQVRELYRLLTAVAPPALSEHKALQIVGPSLRRLRVYLTLRVELLEHAGALSEEVKRRLIALFDTTTGGNDGDGWALGVQLNEEDVALALIDTKYLESLIQVRFLEVADDGVQRMWSAALKPVELVVLDTDPVRIEFVTAGVMA